MNSDTRFLSCDWGTTAFRIRLVAVEGFKIIAESSSKQGNASVFEQWKERARPEEERAAFYTAILQEHIEKLEAGEGLLKGLPLIISGMASSTVGMMELPYKPMPFALDGSDLSTKLLPASKDFSHPILLISGVCTDDDVMRGEEVQVVGCRISSVDDALIIHPGTHCKHIIVNGGKAVSFKTYMTGELFSLLSTKSILAASIEAGGDFENAGNRRAFEDGMNAAAEHGLLHAAFLVRTGDLFRKRSKAQAFYFLSGLLIGTELASFPEDFAGTVILAGEAALVAQYRLALNVAGISRRIAALTIKEADDITLAGQWAVYRHHQQSSDLNS